MRRSRSQFVFLPCLLPPPIQSVDAVLLLCSPQRVSTYIRTHPIRKITTGSPKIIQGTLTQVLPVLRCVPAASSWCQNRCCVDGAGAPTTRHAETRDGEWREGSPRLTPPPPINQDGVDATVLLHATTSLRENSATPALTDAKLNQR